MATKRAGKSSGARKPATKSKLPSSQQILAQALANQYGISIKRAGNALSRGAPTMVTKKGAKATWIKKYGHTGAKYPGWGGKKS